MPRADLLALSPDDLTALTNRGTVKRAQREIEGNEVAGELAEADDGTVTAKWSDGANCVLPGGAVVAAGRCSCPATELCRHIVRTVLAYQKSASESQPAGIVESWNPGTIGDDELARHFKPAVLAQARQQFQNGLLIEILTGAKPTARFHDLACTLRFQVAGDARYVHCDCAAEPPCLHVPLAVWAFRRLPAGAVAGLISTQEKALPVPVDLLNSMDEVLEDGLEFGVSGSGTAWRDRLARLEKDCRTAGLIWPAEVIVDLIHGFERYAERDAGFDPDGFAELLGELLIRADAIRRDTGAVPQLLIRGSASDRWTDLAGSRFIGLGCGVRPGRRQATLTAYLQDANSGSMVAVARTFPDPPAESKDRPKDFWQLAQTPMVRGATFAQVGAGQLLTQGGKRATNHELVLGRAKATVNPQNFSWESLRAPVLAESFAEVRERLRILPPGALRPRRVAEDFFVCAVAGVERAAFVPSTQAVQAVLQDSRGDRAVLRHRYSSRGGEGAERLIAGLSSRVRFVAGPMRLASDGLCVEPVAVVLDGEPRSVIQPWIDRRGEAGTGTELANEDAPPPDAIEEFQREWLACLADTLVVGLRRSDARVLKGWQDLERRADELGLARLASLIRPVSLGLAEKAASARWDWRPTARAMLVATAWLRMARESGA